MSISKQDALKIVRKYNRLSLDKISDNFRKNFPSAFDENDIEILYGDGSSNGFENLLYKLIDFDKKNDEDINLNFINFKSIMAFDSLNDKPRSMLFKYSTFLEHTSFNDCISQYKLIFHHTKFNSMTFRNFTSTKPIEFHYCTFNDEVYFDNAISKKYVSFESNTYNKVCNLSSMNFNNRVVFFNNDYKQGIDIEKSIFNDNFPPLFTFYDVKISSATAENRESAKRIKHFIEQKGDIIESNKWYAIEMEKYEKELYKNKKNNLFDWLVFKIHKHTSNHSQDFVIAFLWICFLISANFIFLSEKIYEVDIFIIFTWTMMYLIISFFLDTTTNMSNAKYSLYAIIFPLTLTTILLTIIILTFGSDGTCNYEIFKKSINIFNIIFTLESSNPVVMLYNVISKAIMIFLSYQFIISIRQNTRRK